jgi:hypothetical protein
MLTYADDGTFGQTKLKLAGCSKIYASRTEMLKELNTTGADAC